jgi:tripartite-type tricarboxylate transporter receptor subunit TctC
MGEKMPKLRSWIAAFIAAAALVGASRIAAAQDAVANFYKGKTVSVMIGYSPGGTDELWARLLAQHLGAYLPGHPTVIPVNVPGAGSLLLANQIYNTQPEDGTVIGLINRGLPFEKLLKGPGILFDPLKTNWIGSPDRDTGVCAARKDAPVTSMNDLTSKQLVVGATGSGADTNIYPQVLSHLLGLKFKIVSGYPGSSDISVAIERGEVQGECVSYVTVERTSYFKQGKLNVLLQLAPTPDPRIKNVPLVTNLAKTDLQKQALNLFILRVAVGRPFMAGPKVPADRLKALRTAFEQAMKDPDLLDQARKSGLYPQYVAPEQIADAVKQAYATPKPAVDALTKAFGR